MDKSSQQSRTFDLRIFAALLVSAFALALAFTLSPASAYAADGGDSKASAPTEQAAQKAAAKAVDTGKEAATGAATNEAAKTATASQDAQAAKPAAEAKAEAEAEPAKAEVKEEAKAETAKTEAKAEPAKTEAKAEAKAEVKAEPAKTEAKAETAKAEAKAEPAKAEAKTEAKAEVKTAAAEKAPAQAKKKTYTVKFYDAYGNVVKTQKVKAGKNAKAPKLTKMANRTFKKWDTSFKKVSSNLYVHPIFKDSKKIYNVVRDYRDSKFSNSGVSLMKYKAGTKITLGQLYYGQSGSLVGWNTKPDGSGKQYATDAEIKMPSKDLFLYPQYKKSKPATKTLYLNSGRNESTNTYELEKGSQLRIGDMAVQSVAGYTLVGYSTKKNGKGKFYALGDTYTMPSKNTTLYGVWKKNNAKLRLKANYTKGSDVVVYVPAGYAIPLQGFSADEFTRYDANRTGYILKSFSTKKKGGKKYVVYSDEDNLFGGSLSYVTVPKKGTTLYAQWAKDKTKKITYKGNGGNLNEVSLFTPGELAYTISWGSRDGYQLVGFSTSKNGKGTYYYPDTRFTMGKKNMTLYAQWKKYDTKVTVKKGDSKSEDTVLNAVTGYGVSLWGNYDASKHKGKYRAGYNAKKNGKGAADYYLYMTAPKAKKVTVYQKWAKGVALTYNSNYKGAAKSTPSLMKKGSAITVYTYANERYRTGYTFVGWSKKKSGKVIKDGTVVVLKKNLTLYAQWKKNSATITFNGNGGVIEQYKNGMWKTSKTVKIKAAKGARLENTPATPERKGYTFVGWNTKKNGKGNSYAQYDLYRAEVFKVTKTTYYAQWAKSPTITFYANNGTKNKVVQPDPKTAYGWAYIPSLDDTKGFTPKKNTTLTAWNTKKNGKGESFSVADNLESLPAAGLKVYAQWTKGNAKVTYSADGKAKNQTIKAKGNAYNVIDANVSTPTNKDYYFKGWYTKKNGKGERVGDYSSATFVPKKGITYYAYWGKKMTVKLDANGGTGSATAKLSGNYNGSDYFIDLYSYSSKFSKSGSTLIGWDTNKNATDPTFSEWSLIYYDSDGISFKDGGTMTIYAIWQADSEV